MRKQSCSERLFLGSALPTPTLLSMRLFHLIQSAALKSRLPNGRECKRPGMPIQIPTGSRG